MTRTTNEKMRKINRQKRSNIEYLEQLFKFSNLKISISSTEFEIEYTSLEDFFFINMQKDHYKMILI